MSDLDLYADLLLRKLVTSDGGTVSLPVLVLGDQCVSTLRLLEHGEGDALRETNLNVRTLRASIGNVLAPPTDGIFKLRFVGDPSGELKPGSSAADLKTALETLDSAGTYQLQEVTASSVPGCWLLRFASTAAIPLGVATNTLKPESFVRIRAFEQSGQRWHEIRLVQTPAVFTGTHERVLPPPPSVTRVRGGSTQGSFKINEVQALIVPAEFRGTYYLRWDFRTTKLLGIEDGPDEIAAALNAMFTGGGTRFAVTNPEPDHAYVEFTGDLGGEPQPLMEVSVHSFEPGVLTFTLDLARAELASALREVAQIELPFEVEIEVVDAGQDAADPAIPGRLITLFQQPITIAREQIWEELADIPAIDWIRPPQPKDYIPFTREQIITGSQHYVAVIGDGAQHSVQLDHHLGTSAFHLTIRENKAVGRRLRDDEFILHFPSDNEAVIDFPAGSPPPALDSLVVTISTAGPKAAFARHTHYIGEIIGLEDALFAIGARLAAIEDLLPTSTLARRESSTQPLEIEIPDLTLFFPSGRLPADFDPKSLEESKAVLPRAPGLLPALHDATVVDVGALPVSMTASAGNVFRNTSGAPLLVPGGLGRRGGYLESNGCFGSDGRLWYRLDRSGTSNSFYPADFERELFLLPIMAEMWQPGGNVSLSFDLDLRTVEATTRAQYVVVIEVGTPAQQTAPAPVAVNLSDIIWRATPILAQRVILSGLKMKHHFGALIRRSLTGDVLSAEKLLYTAWTAASAGSEPATPTFVLRVRLIEFDTENSVPNTTGFIYAALTQAKASIS